MVDSRAARFRPLDERTIADAITETSPGNYVLGYIDGSDFTVFYVGRSDSDVASSLQGWVDAPSRPRRERSALRAPWGPAGLPLPAHGRRSRSRAAFGVDTGYTHFAFRYATTAIAAYETECRDYHEFGGGDRLDNASHPRPPQDSPWSCPLHR